MAGLTAEHVSPVVASNLLAPIHVTHVVLPLLTAAQGTVVNVSTAVGQRAWPGSSLYAATKAALESLTRSWAVELAAHGVRVVGVAPGAINTTIGERNGMTAAQMESLREWQIRHTPMGRLGEPEEVADAIVTRVVNIKYLLAAGLTLDDVQVFQPCLDGDVAAALPSAEGIRIARTRLRAIDARIAAQRAVRERLATRLDELATLPQPGAG